MSSAKSLTIAVAPALAEQRVDFNAIAAEFGLSIGNRGEEDTIVVAVLCDLGDDPWKALQAAADEYPFAKVVGCARISVNIDLQALSERGLYHLLNIPIESTELRQCMGFLASALEKNTPFLYEKHAGFRTALRYFMKVTNLATRQVATLDLPGVIANAAPAMRSNQIGALVVRARKGNHPIPVGHRLQSMSRLITEKRLADVPVLVAPIEGELRSDLTLHRLVLNSSVIVSDDAVKEILLCAYKFDLA